MQQHSDPDQWTHKDIVASARHGLVFELGIEDSDLARGFLALPVGPRVKAGGVRASLARFVAERIAADVPKFSFGQFNEEADTLVLHARAELTLSDELALPVKAAVSVPLIPLVQAIVASDDRAINQLVERPLPEVANVTRKLRESPPTYAGFDRLTREDVERAFLPNLPLLAEKKELFRRIQQACAYAVDRELVDSLARRNPAILDYLQCFPIARAMKRKVVAWLGPTNSGKTHRAVIELSKASSGMYLGPLRLLALEQRDRMVEMGHECSLITGEERDETSTTHSSRTVEMTDFSRTFEVCVLDEMQLALDRDRGWAWVAAYCGVAAETLFVTGPSSTESVIRRLAELCGDDVEINHVERHGTLSFEGVLDWKNIPPRSAVIGFSRAMVLEMKAMFESRGLRVAVIYGGLTPEVRRNEARRFRDGEADIVCATDAIGLGLNLPLDRVIFYETDKFDGEINRRLDAAEIRQIGGRAGRGIGSHGWIAALSTRDARRIQAALAEAQSVSEPELLPAAPTAMHIRAIADHLGLDRLQPILDFFRTRLTFPGGTFFPEVRENVFGAALLVDTYAPNLSVELRYALACTPIDLEEHAFRNTFAEWLESLAAGREILFPRRVDSGAGLEGLEEVLQLITIYRWLALKFPEAFTDGAWVEQLRRECIEQTQAILRRTWGKHGLKRRECAHCGRAMLPSSPHRTCRECYSEGYA